MQDLAVPSVPRLERDAHLLPGFKVVHPAVQRMARLVGDARHLAAFDVAYLAMASILLVLGAHEPAVLEVENLAVPCVPRLEGFAHELLDALVAVGHCAVPDGRARDDAPAVCHIVVLHLPVPAHLKRQTHRIHLVAP